MAFREWNIKNAENGFAHQNTLNSISTLTLTHSLTHHKINEQSNEKWKEKNWKNCVA